MSKTEADSPTLVIGTAMVFIDALSAALEDYTVGAQQQLLLLSLYVHGTLNQQDLPKYTGVERSANSRNISRLGPGSFALHRPSGTRGFTDGLGLVESFDDPMDRRVKMVRLTPKGKALLDSVAARAAPHLGTR